MSTKGKTIPPFAEEITRKDHTVNIKTEEKNEQPFELRISHLKLFVEQKLYIIFAVLAKLWK